MSLQSVSTGLNGVGPAVLSGFETVGQQAVQTGQAAANLVGRVIAQVSAAFGAFATALRTHWIMVGLMSAGLAAFTGASSAAQSAGKAFVKGGQAVSEFVSGTIKLGERAVSTVGPGFNAMGSALKTHWFAAVCISAGFLAVGLGVALGAYFASRNSSEGENPAPGGTGEPQPQPAPGEPEPQPEPGFEEPQPGPVIEQPAAEEPVVVQEQPAAEEPVVVQEQPVAEEPVVVQEQPVAEEPVVVQEQPAAEEPVVVQELPAAEEPVVVQELPAAEEPVPAAMGGVDLATDDESSSSDEEEPVAPRHGRKPDAVPQFLQHVKALNDKAEELQVVKDGIRMLRSHMKV